MPPEIIRIVQLTDCHLGSDPRRLWNGVDTHASLRSVVDHIERARAGTELVVASGDLSHDGSTDSYRALRTILAHFSQEVICLAGNHDEVPAMAEILCGERISMPRAVVTGGWQLIILHTPVRGETGGHLSADELVFLENRLHSHPRHFALVFLHHHPLPVGNPWMDRMGVDNGAQLLSLLSRHPNLRALAWGHVHQCFDTTREGVRLLGTPATCAQFRPGCEEFTLDDKPPGYRWIDLHPDGRIETGIEWVEQMTESR